MTDCNSSSHAWPPLYTIKRHRRARHVKLRASGPRGLEITVPYRFNVREIPSILEENKLWIEKQLAVLALHLHPPAMLPDLIDLKAINESWRISYINVDKKIQLVQRHQLGELALVGNINDTSACKTKMKIWLKNRAKIYLPRLLGEMSELMQTSYTKVTIRNQKTLWGSCTVDKSINLNYKLIFLPCRLVRHILIH